MTLYEGSKLICESIQQLRASGFQLVAIQDVFIDQAQLHTLQVNGIFLRSEHQWPSYAGSGGVPSTTCQQV